MNKYAKAECTVCGAYFEIAAAHDQALIIFQAHGILVQGQHDFQGDVVIFTKPDKPTGKRRAA